MASDTLIKVRDLVVSYGDYRAVGGVSFSVERGELYALLGTNGAGKTSTLETLEGHRAPFSGTVTAFGLSPRDRRSVRPRTGIMLQESGFAPTLTVLETVKLFGALSGRGDDARRVVEVAGLAEKARVRVSQLSGGEKRKLDFATAIYGTPELIFLDEPTAGLDIEARDQLWAAVDVIRGQGATVILTTHYLEEAEQHADRIGLMHRGKIRMEGSFRELARSFPAKVHFEAAVEQASIPFPAEATGPYSWVIATDDAERDVYELQSWARRHEIGIHGLAVRRASLDDIFRTLSR
ncbi:ABC transporter ATP-binding protein [Brevibacterium album]|uniref:ABC transporter ATP-binding protein n=1 Tax=Brevibacterium album TaxID=417948 RepID=UPI00041653FE|nr:ABC transporter ATP-binding protein [Brevibacterium album]